MALNWWCAKAVAAAQVFQVGAELEVCGGLQFFRLGFQRVVVPCPELVDALLVDVKADDGLWCSCAGALEWILNHKPFDLQVTVHIFGKEHLRTG